MCAVRSKTPECVKPTDPATLRLEPCSWCAGRCWVPVEAGGPEPCPACSGGGFEPVRFDLGSTRSCPRGRPAGFNPGLRRLHVTRGRKVEVYDVAELPCGNGFEGRGFEVVKTGTGEVRHCFVCRDEQSHICDCEGQTYAAAEKANRRAWEEGRETFPTAGCLHLDAVILLLRAGLLDLPRELPPDPEGGGPFA